MEGAEWHPIRTNDRWMNIYGRQESFLTGLDEMVIRGTGWGQDVHLKVTIGISHVGIDFLIQKQVGYMRKCIEYECKLSGIEVCFKTEA